jgi:hypothetical protein
MGAPFAGAISDQEFQELLDKARLLLERIRIKCDEIVRKINNLLSSIPSLLVPEYVVEGVQAGIRKMNDLFARLWSNAQEFFDSPGSPFVLFDAADRWLNDVARPAAETEEKINVDYMNVDNYWRGAAAEAYIATLGTQQSAFAAMVDVARKIKECLHAAAWGILKFWGAVTLGLVAAVAGIFAAYAAIAGVVSAPAAPIAAAGAILAAIVAISSGVWALVVEFQGVKDQATALREESVFNTAFDGDGWPRGDAAGEWEVD